MIRIIVLLFILHGGAIAQKRVNAIIIDGKSDTLRGQLRIDDDCFPEKIRLWEKGARRSYLIETKIISKVIIEGGKTFERMPLAMSKGWLSGYFKKEVSVSPTVMMRVAYLGFPLSLYEYKGEGDIMYYYLLDSSAQHFNRVQFIRITDNDEGWENTFLKADYYSQMRALAEREGLALPQNLNVNLAYHESDILRLVKFINKDKIRLE